MNNQNFRPVILTIILYAVLALVFTAVSMVSRPSGTLVGVLRPLDEIPAHVFLLAAGGLALGFLASLGLRRFDIWLVILIPSVVVLTDLDHLPSALGLVQAVRPVHSFVFLAVSFVAVAMIIRRLDLSVAVMSGFFAHLGVDTGIFPPLSPLSFSYYHLGPFQVEFLAAASACALAAGLLGRRRTR